MNKKAKKNIVLIVIGLIYSVWIFYTSIPNIASGKGLGRSIYTTKDSTLIEHRHAGYINLKCFKELVDKKCPGASLTIKGDSVTVEVKQYAHYFYSQNRSWTHHYKDLPIRVTDTWFRARVEKKDTTQYVFLPYQILVNLVMP
jgi:hypothetical protein